MPLDISPDEKRQLIRFLKDEKFRETTISDDELLKILDQPQIPDYQNDGSIEYIISQDTPIYRAARKDEINIIKILLKLGIDVNLIKKLNGATPLLIAAQEGHEEAVMLLLVHENINVNKPNNFGETPLFMAAAHGHAQVVRILLEDGRVEDKALTTDGSTPLYIAAQEGKLDVVQVLLAHDADVNQTENDETTPLYIAAQNGHAEVVRLLLADDNIDVNQATKPDGETPLYIAAQNGHAEVVRLLLKHPKIKVNKARTNNGETPLIFAAANGHANIVRLLLANGADVNKADNDGWTPLFMAAATGNTDVVSLLLFYGATIPNPLPDETNDQIKDLLVNNELITKFQNITELLSNKKTGVEAKMEEEETKEKSAVTEPLKNHIFTSISKEITAILEQETQNLKANLSQLSNFLTILKKNISRPKSL